MKVLRNIVNGKLLNQFNNQPVSVMGVVSHISPSKQSFEMKTTDDVTVTVNLATPCDDPLEGYVEVSLSMFLSFQNNFPIWTFYYKK